MRTRPSESNVAKTRCRVDVNTAARWVKELFVGSNNKRESYSVLTPSLPPMTNTVPSDNATTPDLTREESIVGVDETNDIVAMSKISVDANPTVFVRIPPTINTRPSDARFFNHSIKIELDSAHFIKFFGGKFHNLANRAQAIASLYRLLFHKTTLGPLHFLQNTQYALVARWLARDT